jgi:hypothetical protein
MNKTASGCSQTTVFMDGRDKPGHDDELLIPADFNPH